MASVQTKPTAERSPESLGVEFQRLADAWQHAVAHHSSLSKRENHPTYQQIIALGPAAVPLMLRDLEINGRQWFTALTAITGANPVAQENAGKIPLMIEAWLNWGKQKGYRW